MELPKDAKRAKGWLIWTSVVMIAIFLGLTFQSYFYVVKKEPKVTDAIAAGNRVFHDNNCMDCHTILGDGAYYAADLTKVISKRGQGFVRAVLKDPPKITRDLWPGKYKRVMPNLNLTNQNINDLIAFLTWIGELDTNGWPPGSKVLSSKGKAKPVQEGTTSPISLIKKLNCGTCHTIKTEGLNTVGAIGPDLSNESARNRGVDWLVKQIGNPASIPDSEVTKGYEGKRMLMPAFKNQLTADQLKSLATFINNLKEEK